MRAGSRSYSARPCARPRSRPFPDPRFDPGPNRPAPTEAGRDLWAGASGLRAGPDSLGDRARRGLARGGNRGQTEPAQKATAWPWSAGGPRPGRVLTGGVSAADLVVPSRWFVV